MDTSVNLGGRNFNLSVKADKLITRRLEALSSYMSEQQKQFVIADMQNRLADYFEANCRTSSTICTEDVEQAFISIGLGPTPESIKQDDEEQTARTDGENKKNAEESRIEDEPFASTTSSSSAQQQSEPKRDNEDHGLYRYSTGSVIGGVCLGIAKWMNINPAWLRLGLIVVMLLACQIWIPLIYVVLWIVLPTGDVVLAPDGRPVALPKSGCSGSTVMIIIGIIAAIFIMLSVGGIAFIAAMINSVLGLY